MASYLMTIDAKTTTAAVTTAAAAVAVLVIAKPLAAFLVSTALISPGIYIANACKEDHRVGCGVSGCGGGSDGKSGHRGYVCQLA